MPLTEVPTNIITGFLGAGKTTAIKHLLAQKPIDERWAVLVNEFGEVGIDGSLLAGGCDNAKGVFIREVPGGCMCCAAGLPMQIALNMLLTRAKPQRLLIEPTGLGHPKEVVAALSAEHYREILSLNNTLALVDARKISDKRYTDHDTFNQQLDIADVIIANKTDQYGDEDFPRLLSYLGERHGAKVKPIYPVSYGKLNLAWLEGTASATTTDLAHHHATSAQVAPLSVEPTFPASGYLSIANEGEGFVSQGWIFKPDFIFDRQKISSLLLGVKAERVKGVFITYQGVIAFNKADNVLTEMPIDDSMDSRIELIAASPTALTGLEESLLACAQSLMTS